MLASMTLCATINAPPRRDASCWQWPLYFQLTALLFQDDFVVKHQRTGTGRWHAKMARTDVAHAVASTPISANDNWLERTARG
jgi:hypothetical protein